MIQALFEVYKRTRLANMHSQQTVDDAFEKGMVYGYIQAKMDTMMKRLDKLEAQIDEVFGIAEGNNDANK